LSEEKIKDLALLDPSRFEMSEYVALTWVRAFLTRPDGVPVEIEEEFQSVFTPRDREHIMAAMKGMFFINLAVNTNRGIRANLRGSSSDDQASSCRVEPPA
jgi:hypothetical protein